MRKLFGLALGLALAACSPDPSGPVSPEPLAPGSDDRLTLSADGHFVEGRLLVRFRPGAPKTTLLSAERAKVLRHILLGIEEIEVPAGYEKAIAAVLERSGWVEFAEPDYVRTFGIPCATGDCTAPTDGFFGYKWDLHNDGTITNAQNQNLMSTGAADADMDWLEAFDQIGSLTGSARIAVLDTGIDKQHPDLQGRVVLEADLTSSSRPRPADKEGHGTHVAGIAAARGDNGQGVSGVAWGPNIQLMNGKVCQSNGCPTSAIVAGIQWAVDNGANVINLSLGGPFGSSSEQAALAYARANNVLPFCAAGNDGGPVNYPAAFPECVAVSATDWSDNLASYSSNGPQIELAAPGGDDEDLVNGYSFILSTWRKERGCNPCYVFSAGTSMATPQAAGLAGLLHAMGITDDDAKLQRMKETADDLGPAGNDNQFGAGRINVYRAINGGPPPPAAQCANGQDDDNDGKIDFPLDPGCSSLSDDSESPDPPPTQCSNGQDDDNDGQVDFPADPGCSSLADDSEAPDPPPAGNITLSASKAGSPPKAGVDLSWSGASGAQVQILMDGSVLVTTGNDGSHKERLADGLTGQHTFQVCESGGSPCSNMVQLTY